MKPTEQTMDAHKLARHYLVTTRTDARNRRTLRYWRGDWWIWDGRRYFKRTHDEMEAELFQKIKEHVDADRLVDQFQKAYRVTGSLVTNVMKALKGMTILPDATEQPCWIGQPDKSIHFLAMGNGLLDLEAAAHGQAHALLPHSPDWFSPVSVPYDYEPSATCPEFLKFVNRVLERDQERIAIIQEFLGYCLTTDTRFHKMLVLEGEGQNGKSVLMDLMIATVGEQNVSNVQLELFGDRFQLTPTLGKLINISSETDEATLSEGVIKQFVAGDMMMFDRKNQSQVQARPTAKVVVSTNNPPPIRDKSNGFWRRILPVPFRIQVPPQEQNHRLAKEIEEKEISGILNWALVGLARLRKQNGFSKSTQSERWLRQYQRNNNPMKDFIEEKLGENLTGHVTRQELFAAYKEWAEGHGHQVKDATSLYQEIRRAFPMVSERKMTLAKGQRAYAFIGIQLASVPERQDLVAA